MGKQNEKYVIIYGEILCFWKEIKNSFMEDQQWRTEGGFGVFKHPPPKKNSEDIGGILDRINKKNRRLDFLW